MKILSIDTSSKLCTIAILEDSILLKEHTQDSGLTHSETLIPRIKEMFEELNLALNDIDLIVCDKGPGSFTGIRIGVATAKAFSDSLEIESIGISSLESLVYNVKEDGLICSLIDARNENVYVSIFERVNGTYILKKDFSVETISDIVNELKNYKRHITFVGDGAVNYKNEIENVLFDKSQFVTNNDLSAYNLAIAGLSHYKNNERPDILPLYLRKPQAERILEQKNNMES